MIPASHHDFDSISTSSAASTPRADRDHDSTPPRLRFMCSFGGKILPRPHDNQLRYVGGDTRIIAVSRHTTFSALLSKLAKTIVGTTVINNLTVKYQLPNEDLDALISVSNDEDVENMMDEYERMISSKTARLRLFLFDDDVSRTSSISSLLNGSSRRESWFFDALNGGGSTTLERGLSEASSIVSEVPDYLFGLDNCDEPPTAVQLREPKLRTRSNLADCVSYSDPGSPAPAISSSPSTLFSTSSALPPVKTKIETPAQAVMAQMERQVEPLPVSMEQPVSVPMGLIQSSPMWQYNPDPHYSGPTANTSFQPMPVYYIPGPVQPAPVQAQFVQMQPGQQHQVPTGYHPAGVGVGMGMGQNPSGGMMRPNHPVPGYYGPVHVYPGMVTPASLEEHVGSRSDAMGSGVGQ
ncbi:hypothetical protein QQ045_030781 [Rhodiola kirilowii]